MRLEAGPEDRGVRLDHYLHSKLPEYSRSRLQSWIKSGSVRVEDAIARPSYVLRGKEKIDVDPQPLPSLRAAPEDLPVDVLFEDESIAVINKPAGLVVHAGAGVHSGTLVNALLHRYGTLAGSDVDRPGIVHRLDRFTSGVLVVARTDTAHQSLARQFASRTVEKTYIALVHGVPQKTQGTITRPVTRDPVRRARMTSRTDKGRAALTRYRVIEILGEHALLEVDLGTGRTHQIRVHFADSGYPVVGDHLYGAPRNPQLGRYFLHALRLTFAHPLSGERVAFTAPLAGELEKYLAVLREGTDVR